MASDILKKEFIGTHLRVVDADNRALIGIEGIVVDETKNTLKVQVGDKQKVLLKDQMTFETFSQGKKVKIDGKKICFRPEDRVKKIR